MHMKTLLQIPMDKNLRIDAEEVAEEMGFSSLQEVIRLFVSQLAAKNLMVNFIPRVRDEYLTEEQEKVLEKKYKEKSKLYEAKTAEEFMDQIYR